MKNKYCFCLLILILIVIFIVGCSSQEPQTDPREKEIMDLLRAKDYQGAENRAKEVFEGEDKLQHILSSIGRFKEIDEEISDTLKGGQIKNSDKLEIQWHNHKIENNYIYITGRIMNISNQTISYFEVVAKYLGNNGQVLDSGYTNSSLSLSPGEMREFSIMHRWNDDYKQYSLSVDNIR